MTDGDLLEVPADWPCKAGDKIKFEHVLSAGSTDFTLVGRPTISSEIVEGIITARLHWITECFSDWNMRGEKN